MYPSLRLILSLYVSGLLMSCSENPENSKVAIPQIEEAFAENVIRQYNQVAFQFSNLDIYYGRLDVVFDQDTVITLSDPYLELEAPELEVGTQIFEMGNASYIFITGNNRPEPHFYYVFKSSNKGVELVGKTEESTRDFIADVDNDGKLEIGGFNSYCQAGALEQLDNPDFCMDHFRVYEIGSDIIRDAAAEAKQSERIRLERPGRTELSKDVAYSELLPSQVSAECVVSDFEILQALQWKSGTREYVLVSSRKGLYPSTGEFGSNRLWS